MIQNLFGWLVGKGHTSESTFEAVKFGLGGVLTIAIVLSLCLFTSLGRNIKNSFTWCNSSRVEAINQEE